MKKEIIVSGLGGQGVMSIGKLLVEAGIREGMEATWVPSYGPEMRGGAAKCSIVLSDKKVGAPIFDSFDDLIAMSEMALKKNLDGVRTGGNIFLNSDVIKNKVKRDDVKVYYVNCDSIAGQLGNKKTTNMVMLGAYVKASQTINKDILQDVMHNLFSGNRAKLEEINIKALEMGMESISNYIFSPTIK